MHPVEPSKWVCVANNLLRYSVGGDKVEAGNRFFGVRVFPMPCIKSKLAAELNLQLVAPRALRRQWTDPQRNFAVLHFVVLD